MSSYTKGARFERRVKRYLEKFGYLVIRAAGSKPIDLVCLRDDGVLIVECKVSRNELKPSTLEKLFSVPIPRETRIIVALRERRKIVLLDAKTRKKFTPRSISETDVD